MISLKPANWGKLNPRQWQIEAFEVVRQHLSVHEPESAIISAIMGSGKSLLISAIACAVELQSNEVVVISTSTEHLVESFYDDFKAIGACPGVWYGRMKRLGNIIITCVPSVKTLAARLKASGKNVKLWIADEVHRTECGNILACYEELSPNGSIGFTATAFRSIHKETISLFEKVIYRYGIKQALQDDVVVPWRIVHRHEEIPEDINVMYYDMIKDAVGPGLANADDIEDAEKFATYLNWRGIPSRAIHSRLHNRIKKAIIHDLRTEKIKCIVHVNMLSEGANFPFLMWALLRRQVEARVRFIQEIGRLLRSFPGKKEAVFYDPHDLFGSFCLSYSEALGEVIQKEKPPKEEILTPEDIIRTVNEGDPPLIMTTIESAIRGLTVACDAQTNYPRRILNKIDRVKPSTPLQKMSIKSGFNLLNGWVPENWKRCLDIIIDKSENVRFGFMADLIWVLSSVRESQKWPSLINESITINNEDQTKNEIINIINEEIK